jgi:hypothetical protein
MRMVAFEQMVLYRSSLNSDRRIWISSKRRESTSHIFLLCVVWRVWCLSVCAAFFYWWLVVSETGTKTRKVTQKNVL